MNPSKGTGLNRYFVCVLFWLSHMWLMLFRNAPWTLITDKTAKFVISNSDVKFTVVYSLFRYSDILDVDFLWCTELFITVRLACGSKYSCTWWRSKPAVPLVLFPNCIQALLLPVYINNTISTSRCSIFDIASPGCSPACLFAVTHPLCAM